MTLAKYIGKIKPVSYYTFNGIEQHTNAMQTNRALCILYSLTGDLDKPGGNVFFPSIPTPKIYDPKLMPPETHGLRLGFKKRPLGPATAFITTEKPTLRNVCGKAATAHTASISGTL